MRLAESRYNYEFHDNVGTAFICNGLSGTIIAKPDLALTDARLPTSAREFLLAHHFVRDEDSSEVEALLERNHIESELHDRLELTVMLHEECNFRCTYCFEEFRDRKFEARAISELISFIELKLPERGVLYLHYYGGEPLLAWDALVAINDRLKSVISRKSAAKIFYLTTNGSLLSQPKAAYLAAEGIAHVKMTLDGPPEVHNLRRKRVGGGGTFQSILKNLVSAIKLLKVILRVNVDATNIGTVPHLLQILEGSCRDGWENLYLDFSIVYEPRTGLLRNGIGYPEVYHLQAKALARGFQLSLPPLTRSRHCKFNSSNSYLIDSAGSLFLCSNVAETRVGSLMSGPSTSTHPSATASVSLPILASDPVTPDIFRRLAEPCKECNLLPICGGGCRLLAAKSTGPPCPPWKGYLQDYLRIQLQNATPRRARSVGPQADRPQTVEELSCQ